MAGESSVLALRWQGAQSIKAARDAIAAGRRVEIELPLEDHYALYRHLYPQVKRAAAKIDASGGAELLAAIADVAGMDDARKLSAAVARANYRVRVTSPEPLLALIPPAKKRTR
jgi:hypothetical protein